jgi:hypothetical protein
VCAEKDTLEVEARRTILERKFDQRMAEWLKPKDGQDNLLT